MTEQEAFFHLFSGLPRQGPGSDDATARALWMVPELPARPDILDLGCGTGGPTLMLARLLDDARVTAVDTHQPYLDELARAAAAEGLDDRIHPVCADMAAPPSGPFDVIWSEGSAYCIGFERALADWAPLLQPGGSLVISEVVWAVEEPPAEARAFWREEYPAMHTREERREQVGAAGLTLVGDFALPDTDWWTQYYEPLESRVERLRAGASGALRAVLDATEREIDLRRRHADAYDAVFFVATLPGGDG